MRKIKDEAGFGTLEIVIIIAVLITIALLFRSQIQSFATTLFNKVFDHSVIQDLGPK